MFGNGVGCISNLVMITTAGSEVHVYKGVEDSITINPKAVARVCVSLIRYVSTTRLTAPINRITFDNRDSHKRVSGYNVEIHCAACYSFIVRNCSQYIFIPIRININGRLKSDNPARQVIALVIHIRSTNPSERLRRIRC